MFAASAPFAAMVEGVDQRVEWLLTMALTDAAGNPVAEDVTLALESCRIEAQSQTDVPDQVRMQSGFPTIAVTFTLSGDVGGMSAADFFRRWNRDSPLWLSDALNAKVTVDIGLLPDGAAGTPELIRKATVFVDSYTCKTDGTVEFDCVDKAALLRAIPSTRGLMNIPPYNMGGTSEFLIDSALRAVTRDDPRLGFSSTWPDQRPRCVFAAGMRSSFAPEVGGVDIGSNIEPMKQPEPSFTTGVFGSALRLIERERFIPNQPDPPDFFNRLEYTEHAFATASTVGDDVFCEFWFGGDVPAAADGAGLNLWIGTSYTDMSVPTPHGGVQVSISSDRIRVATVGDPGHHDWNTTVDWSTPRPVALQLNWPVGGGNLTGTIEVDGTTHTISPIAATRPDTGWSMIRMSKSAPGQRTHIEAFQVSTETAATPSYHSFAPSAVLDKSLNPLLGLPYINDDTSDTRQFFDDLNTAEFAVGGFWEDGVYRTLNRKTIANAPVARTVTSAASLLDLTESNEAAAVINHARVAGYFKGVRTTDSPVPLDMGFAWRIRARSTSIRTFTINDALWDINPTVRLQRDDEFYPGGASGRESTYLASADPDGLAPHAGGLTITVRVISQYRLRVTVHNRSNQDAWLVAPATHVGSYTAGQISLYIAGGESMFLQGPTTVEWSYPDDPTAGRFGDCLWEASGNSINYIQNADTATDLTLDVVTASYLPRPDLTGVAIVPDPRVQIADTIHLVDPDVTGVDDYARVFGWTLELSGGQWDMTVDTRVLAPPGGWLLGYPGRSELGSTAYLMGA